MINFVDHIAYEVGNLDDYVAFMEDIFGLKPEIKEGWSAALDADPAALRKRSRVARFSVGGTEIQAHDPTFSVPGAKYLEEHGPGVRHVAFSVDSLEELARRLKDKGVTFRTTGVPNWEALGAASNLPNNNPEINSYHAISIDADDNPLGYMVQFIEASTSPRG